MGRGAGGEKHQESGWELQGPLSTSSRHAPGLLCHMEDMCLSQPCHREAQCSTNPLTGSTLCLCQPGYSGPTCHQDLDECQMGEVPPHQILSEPLDSHCTEERSRQIVFQVRNIKISSSQMCPGLAFLPPHPALSSLLSCTGLTLSFSILKTQTFSPVWSLLP